MQLTLSQLKGSLAQGEGWREGRRVWPIRSSLGSLAISTFHLVALREPGQLLQGLQLSVPLQVRAWASLNSTNTQRTAI